MQIQLASLFQVVDAQGPQMNQGEAVWHTPEGEFTCGKFNLAEIEYNLGTGTLF